MQWIGSADAGNSEVLMPDNLVEGGHSGWDVRLLTYRGHTIKERTAGCLQRLLQTAALACSLSVSQ
ncbi:MAG: hypothetical protein ACI9W4_000101 [Rhodothermales bacterium]|jgi:hypothetical protein